LPERGAKAALDLLDAARKIKKKLLPTIAQRNWTLLALGKTDELRTGIDAGYKLGRTPDFLIQDAVLHFRAKQFQQGRAL